MSALETSTSTKTKIRDSLSRWNGTLDSGDLPLFRDFVEETLSRLRGPFLAHHAPHQILAYLEEAFTFAKSRPRGDTKVDMRRRKAKGLATMVSMPDQPFIVDTVRLFLRQHRADYWGGFNLVYRALRDDEGNLTSIGTDDAGQESLVMLESDTGDLAVDLEGNRARLEEHLTLARAMVRDFKSMVRAVQRAEERCLSIADSRPDQSDAMRETAALLKWLIHENFVFMGLDDGQTALGIQTVDNARYHSDAGGSWAKPHAPNTVRVRKSQVESPIHRAGRIDEILVSVGADDDPHAIRLFMRGMFTYRAVTQPSRNVPILRRVVASILENQASGPGSFRYKGIANVFDSLPTEFLFTATREAIAEMVDLVFEAEQQQEVGVTFLMNGDDSAFCLAAMPKTQFSDDLRRAVEGEISRTLKATYTDHGLFVGRYDTILLHYFLTGIDNPGDQAIGELTQRIRSQATPWVARLWEALSTRFGESRADRLTDTYGRAFPKSWTRNTTVERAVVDIEHLEELDDNVASAAMFRNDEDQLILRVYQAEDLVLSRILPVLDHFGLTIVDSFATTVKSRGGTMHIDTFTIDESDFEEGVLLDRADLLTDAMQAAFDGTVTDSRLNGLVARAGLSWQEVDIIRAYCSYAQQLEMKLSPLRMTAILLDNPIMTSTMVELFHARFDPDRTGDRTKAIAKADERVTDELRYIIAHDEDLAFSSLVGLVRATLRTNFYRTDRQGWYLSLKFDCSRIRELGEGRPMYEIFVQSRDVHGVHLRFGPVARGGLRWSDRGDYRTEVLGLATTQQVKNVIIVPTGSKGGFHLKHPEKDPKARRAQADELYKTFIRGLLDLTDNNVGGETVHPPRVVPMDGDDPYLVVAADKGTAHLSDTANGISEDYGYWLGDAFASGGSNGYDHKGVGITARGAWVLVKRHFAEMGRDPYNEPFTCAGIGDMGGDVFGNGLVESKKTKLKAAFNHLHIFLDPDPEPAATWTERKRLFDTGGGWDKYDTSLISEGGGIFDRRGKSVPLSPQAQEMLGLPGMTEANPEIVINAILRMDVDLLWNGGIGTYVKASWETHPDADDRSNDAIRIDATELKAKVVGEGGNLGFTQQSRIEADLLGVRLNTDAIDNSAGVDLSDHEVNLKLLLNGVVQRGELGQDERNKVLEEMTDEVADLVLADNAAHGRQLSRDKIRSQENIFQFARAISFVERAFGRSRSTLNLPTNEEMVQRASDGKGLTRPELAVLSAWVKIYVKRELMTGGPKNLPGYTKLLHTYFPKRVRESWPADIDGHMLADDIAVTVATTNMIADAGASFFPVAIESTGASVAEIAEAYLKAQHLAGTKSIRGTLEELRTTVSLNHLYRAWILADRGTQEVAMYWLSARGSIPADDLLDEMKHAARQVYELQSSDVLQRNRATLETLQANDIPKDAAERIVQAQYLNLALTVWAESKHSGIDFAEGAVRHLAIGRASRLQFVLDSLATRPASGRWDPIAMRLLYGRFHNQLRRLVGACPRNADDPSTVDELEPCLANGVLADVRVQVDELFESEDVPQLATLIVLEERIDAAIARLEG